MHFETKFSEVSRQDRNISGESFNLVRHDCLRSSETNILSVVVVASVLSKILFAPSVEESFSFRHSNSIDYPLI